MEAPPIPPIPPEALAGMEGWEAEVAWSLAPGRAVWRLRAPDGRLRYLKAARRAPGLPLAAERARLAWAAARLPVPRVLGYGADAAQEWLLTAALPGVTAIDDGWRADPPRLVPLLAEGLRRLHALPVSDCPFDGRLDGMLRAARERAAAGLVNAREFHRDHAGLTVEAALARLHQLRPREEDLVVCHGDYCLPNVLLSGGRVSGYLDLGQLGVADRWWDLATATWSVAWNLGPGWEDRFLEAYGVRRNSQKQACYRLLYEFTP
jgi:kanamycin kinase